MLSETGSVSMCERVRRGEGWYLPCRPTHPRVSEEEMDFANRFEPPGPGKKHQIRTFRVGSGDGYLVLPVGMSCEVG